MATETFKIRSDVMSHMTWSMAKLSKEGEDYCGDLHLVKQYEDKVLLAVVDGLGHGVRAHQASEKAIYFLKTFNNESLINLVRRCHDGLKYTRGVVISLALIDFWELTLTWIGVGNVEGILFRDNSDSHQKKENIILRGGVVGYSLPSLQASILPISLGDTLIFTTDGVKKGYLEGVSIKKSPKEIVKYIANNYFKKTDDALILVARFTEN